MRFPNFTFQGLGFAQNGLYAIEKLKISFKNGHKLKIFLYVPMFKVTCRNSNCISGSLQIISNIERFSVHNHFQVKFSISSKAWEVKIHDLSDWPVALILTSNDQLVRPTYRATQPQAIISPKRQNS